MGDAGGQVEGLVIKSGLAEVTGCFQALFGEAFFLILDGEAIDAGAFDSLGFTEGDGSAGGSLESDGALGELFGQNEALVDTGGS
jgi:hypothetical protein